MLKTAGCFLVLGSTILLGSYRAAALREQYGQMEYLRQLFYWIQSEMRYAKSPMGEIFSYIGASAKEPYGSWLLSLGEQLKRRDGGVFGRIWETSIRQNLKDCALSREELSHLEELGERLGLADLTMQVKALELYLSRLETSMDELQAEMKTKVRLYHCLGIMSGLLIVTLLL